MSQPQVHLLHGVDQLRAAAPAWDNLWWRSAATRPTARAELIAQWVEYFAPRTDFRALAVEDQGQWVAALPLVGVARYGRFGAGGIPSNEWSSSGALLLDSSAAVDRALDALVAGMGRLPFQLVWLDEVAMDSHRWTALRAAVGRVGMAANHEKRWQVGQIEIGDDWEAYRERWPKKHRRKMTRAGRRLAEQGDVQFEMHTRLSQQQVESWLREGLEVEHRSWKGEAGTSVLRTPEMSQFFVRQARQLAQWGQLELAFLRCRGRPVAFVYGFRAKGVCHWHKIGYDPQYASCSPGQLLQCQILERLHREPEIRAVDTMGPITHALSRWKPAEYAIGRLIIAPRRGFGRVVLYACKHWWPRVRRLTARSPNGTGQENAGKSPSHAVGG